MDPRFEFKKVKRSPLRLFISYSHVDEAFRRRLQVHLATMQNAGLIELWDDHKMLPGDEWDPSIGAKLDSADLILFLVSPDFYASPYIKTKEIPRALEKHRNGTARVVPIRIRPCLWDIDVLSRLQCLPSNNQPVDSREWFNPDEAYTDIAAGLHAVVTAMTRERSSSLSEDDQPLRIYFAYAPQDFDSFQQLHKHLSPVEDQDIIQIRHARSYGGTEDPDYYAPMAWADLIVLLLTPDFLANDHCLREVIPQALSRREGGSAEVVLVLIKDCYWKLTALADCPVLPRDGSAVIPPGTTNFDFSALAAEFLSLIDALLPND